MQGGYLEVSQAEQEATSTDKPISNHPKNISEKGYRCVCLNARSIVNKKNELNIMVEDINPHIIGITESWAKKKQEKDLGVTFNADIKVSEQCGIVASKGNQILRLIKRTITYKEKHLIVPLYKAIVRPHLEYCIQAWRPYRKKDRDKLERIQRRATKMIPELRDLSYESRLL